MGTNFTFNELTKKDVRGYLKTAYVFNVSKDMLREVKLIQNKFSDEYGGSEEKVDIFIYSKRDLVDVGEYLDLKDYFVKETNSGSGYYILSGILSLLDKLQIGYQGIIVVTRTLSNYILDKKNSSLSTIQYHICSDRAYKLLEENPTLDGMLAKNRVKLSQDYMTRIKKAITKDYDDRKLSESMFKKYINILKEWEG